MNQLVEHLNHTYFAGGLSATVCRQLAPLASERDEVRAFVERMCRLMASSRFPATAFSDRFATLISTTVPRLLPGAWGGIIPPITVADRHRRIDAYLACNSWLVFGETGTMLEIGCGFPPLPTVETAQRFPHWRIIGADPALGQYIVYDAQGNYAVYDQEGELQYFQTPAANPDQWRTLLADPATTSARFTGHLHRLLRQLPDPDAPTPAAVADDDARLIRNPLGHYGLPNLSFLRGGIGKLAIRDVDILRCFNVLVYYDRLFRTQCLAWAAGVLKPDGLFLCGVNWTKSLESRYTVYRQEHGQMVEKEFAFSIDNLRPYTGLIPWYALHDDDYETGSLARMVGIIRSDLVFCTDFDARLDALLAEQRLYRRDIDGCLTYIAISTPSEEMIERCVVVATQLDKEGYVDGAIAVLKQAGVDAWRNCVGHVAVANDVDKRELR